MRTGSGEPPWTFWSIVRADLWRIEGRWSIPLLARQLTRGAGFKFVFWMRACAETRSGPLSKQALYPFCRAMYRHYSLKFGISIPFTAQIGPGLFIGHIGTIVIAESAVIGSNCNVSPCSTIGSMNSGRVGVPRIGDRVFIGPGARVLGGITIGDDVAIGANAVVLHDVPDNAVATGIPATSVVGRGSAAYINRVFPGSIAESSSR